MRSNSIRNIVHKQIDPAINIAYFMDNSIFDNIITVLPFNFFGITNIETTIRKPNFCSIKNIEIFDYDLIMCHNHITEPIKKLSLSFHIPIVNYVQAGTNADHYVQNDNIFYIIEKPQTHNDNHKNILQTAPIAMDVSIDCDINAKNNDILIIDYHANHTDKLISIIKQKWPQIKIAAAKPTNSYDANIELFSSSRYCIDINPKSAIHSILCNKTNTIYLTNNSKMGETCKMFNDNSILCEDYESMLRQVELDCYKHKPKTNTISGNSLSNITEFIQRIKKQGLII